MEAPPHPPAPAPPPTPPPTPALRPPRHRVSERARAYWTLRALGGWAVVALAQVVWLLAAGGDGALRPALLALTVVLAALHATIMPRWRYFVHRWESAPEAIYTQSGWLDQERRIAPLTRVQTVDTERGPLEQLFGLATVTVTTASAAGPLRIHALDVDVADALVRELTDAARAGQDDAT